MTKAIASISRTRELMNQFGIHAKKGFGQNFLVDVSIVSRCASAAHIDGAVIEVGPGIGSLTEQLAKHATYVLAYEIDTSLKPVLEESLKDYDNIEIRYEDFLECDISSVAKELEEKYGSCVVVANLPYYITTPILFHLFEHAQNVPYITVMVQKEVGDRFSAKVGSSEYSALSVEAQLLYHIQKVMNVPAKAFMPAPKVDSVIIQFERLEERLPKEEQQDFFAFVKGCFQQRRKTIYNNLKEYLQDHEKAKEVLDHCGIEASKRPQDISVGEYLQLLKEIQK